jgi:tRNA threonylcarbamoyladenosine biosynthesis protein TsaE
MSIQILKTEEETKKLAQTLADRCLLTDKIVIFLCGSLGAGKTTFARYFIHHLGYTGIVRSPTYTLVEEYPLAKRSLYHLDLYRLEYPDAFLETGLQDAFDQPAIWLIEWPERAPSVLLPPDIQLTFQSIDDQQRHLQLDAYTPCGQQVLDRHPS